MAHLKCVTCGISFQVSPCKIKTGRRFCSKSCRRWKSVPFTFEHRQRLVASAKANPHAPWKGLHLPESVREKISLSKTGDQHWNWQGGVTRANQAFRNTRKYQEWRQAVLEKDGHTCKGCGNRGGDLQAHHVKSSALFPQLRFEVNNGEALCAPCHRETENFGGSSKSLAILSK